MAAAMLSPPLGARPAWSPGGAGHAVAPGEWQLRAAVERIARAGPAGSPGWSAVVLHLSRLPAPGARPHHRRVAQALLQDAAQRADGQVFGLRNGDAVLLARGGADPEAGLPDRLRRLFAHEAGDGVPLVSAWALPGEADGLLAQAESVAGEPPADTEPEAPPPALIDAVAAAIAAARPHELIRRQTAIHLDPAGGAMRVGFRELTISRAELARHLPAGARLWDDVALARHLGRVLDPRMLEALTTADDRSPLDPRAGAGFVLHLNLSLPGALSEAFAALAARCREAGTGLGAEISLVEAVADLAGFARAGERLRRGGARLVLDGVPHPAMLLARPWALGADLLKLDWSPRMAELAAAEQAALDDAVAEAGPARIVLHRAESEAAVRWGLARGIRLFQGWQIDQMLAVRRMLCCPGAGACAPRQCAGREMATGAAGRAGCTNPALLDAGLPGPDDPGWRR